MIWLVEYTDEFEAWWHSLNEDEQVSVAASVGLLESLGTQLPFPHSSAINQSRHGHMRELRIQHGGRPLRTLYAFDPRRSAILLMEVIRRGMIDGMKNTFLLLIDSMMNIWRF